MANYALLSLCFLLAVGAVTATATTAAGGAPHRRLQQLPKLDDPPTDVPIPSTVVTGCSKSILASENCVHDIVQSLALFDIRVSKVCCSVLEKIGDKCVLNFFSNFPFNPFYPPLVKRICGLPI